MARFLKERRDKDIELSSYRDVKFGVSGFWNVSTDVSILFYFRSNFVLFN